MISAANGGDAARWRRVEALRQRRPVDRFVRISIGLLGAMMLLAWPLGGFDWGELQSPRRMANLARFLAELRPYPLQGEPFDFTTAVHWAGELLQQQGWAAARATIAISILAILLAGLWGFLLALPAARSLAIPEPYVPDGSPAGALRRLAWTTPRAGTRVLLALLRAVPEYVWAFLLLAIFGPSAWPAILALALHNTGILGRLGAETLENTEPAASAALRGIGASRLQITLLALFPATFARLLLYFFYRWETCVREATVLGMLGIVSLGYWIEEARTRGQYDTLLLLVMLGVGIVLVGDIVSMLARSLARRAF